LRISFARRSSATSFECDGGGMLSRWGLGDLGRLRSGHESTGSATGMSRGRCWSACCPPRPWRHPHRPQHGPVPMVRRRHVSADRHAAAPRRRAAQLRRHWRSKAKRQVARGWLTDTDGMGEVSQDRAVRANIPAASRVPSVRR
jgi:hypothetical protein